MDKAGEIVYLDMKGEGRVIFSGGNFIAQTLITGSRDKWGPASLKPALGLMRKALGVARLKKGDPVVFWEGSRYVLGSYGEPRHGEHFIEISGGTTLHYHVLPLAMAVNEGKWPFKDGLAVAALVNDNWVRAVWRDYGFERHMVELEDGIRFWTYNVHELQKAIQMKLVA